LSSYTHCEIDLGVVSCGVDHLKNKIMKRLIKGLIIVGITAAIIIGGALAYDNHMRTSGIDNRVDYEIQKDNIRNSDYNPVSESRAERRERKKQERRGKVRRFLND
jgi:hypothetical protein